METQNGQIHLNLSPQQAKIVRRSLFNLRSKIQKNPDEARSVSVEEINAIDQMLIDTPSQS